PSVNAATAADPHDTPPASNGTSAGRSATSATAKATVAAMRCDRFTPPLSQSLSRRARDASYRLGPHGVGGGTGVHGPVPPASLYVTPLAKSHVPKGLSA